MKFMYVACGAQRWAAGILRLFYLDFCRVLRTLCLGLGQGPGNSGISHQNWASQVHRTQFSSPRAVIITANVSSLPQPQGATLEPCFLPRSLHLSHEWLSKPSHTSPFPTSMTPFLGEPSPTYKSNSAYPYCWLFPLVFDTLAYILKPSLDTRPVHPCSLFYSSPTVPSPWVVSQVDLFLTLLHRVPYIFT